MQIEVLHIPLATVIVLIWLGILVGWLATCGLGEKSGRHHQRLQHIEAPPTKNKPSAP
jgi:hypothetical protein